MARVLLVEDEEDLRLSWASTLEGEGFTTVSTGDGEAGWDAYATSAPDVVVADLHIPKLHGLDLIRRVCESDPAARVVAVSADLPGLEMARTIGATITLHKPLWPGDLVAAVRSSLQEHRETGPSAAPTAPGRHLADRIREKLAADQLPHEPPVKTWVGYGQNRPCSACGELILPAQTEHRIEMRGGAHLCMHLGCHGLWLGELVRRLGHRPWT